MVTRAVICVWLLSAVIPGHGGQGIQCAGLLSSDAEPPSISPVEKWVAVRHTGSRRAVVVFARFPEDGAADAAVPAWSKDLFDPDLPGSFSHFYDTMSFGQLRVRGEVAPRWYESEHEAAFYLADDPTKPGRFGGFSLEILQRADADIDFSGFDSDGPDGIPNSGDDDGVVDAVFIVTGPAPRGFLLGGATGVGTLGLETHFSTDDLAVDGQPILIVSGQGTIQRGTRYSETVGSMCHEYGHVLGLPDLYNTAYLLQRDAPPEEDSAGIGVWGLMGSGALGWNEGDGPNSFCAWSRMQLGWSRAVEVRREEQEVRLADVGQGGAVYKLPLTDREYFLLENRRRDGYYDRNIPAEGLLIWHVEHLPDTEGRVSAVQVDLRCADGLWLDAGYPLGVQPDPRGGEDNLDYWAHDAEYARRHAGNWGDATDPFDGHRFTMFTPDTNPASCSSDGSRSARVEQIRHEGEIVLATVHSAPPYVVVERIHVADASGDSVMVPGEHGRLSLDVANRGGIRATGLVARLTGDDPRVSLQTGTVTLAQLDVGRRVTLEFGTVRFAHGDIPGPYTSSLRLTVESDQGSVGLQEFAVEALSAAQQIDRITVIDSSANGNGRPDPGEFFRLALTLASSDPDLLRPFGFSLRPLDATVRPASGPRMSFVTMGDSHVVSDHTPEFLLVCPAETGSRAGFEFSVNGGFGAWRDTFYVEVGTGLDATPPRVCGATVFPSEAGLVVQVDRDQILDGSPLCWVSSRIYGGGGAAELARISLHPTPGGYRGVWGDAQPGNYQVQVVAEDVAGNRGYGGLQRITVWDYVAEVWDHVAAPQGGDGPLFRLGKGTAADIVYSPDGGTLAIAGGIGIHLYDADTFEETGLLPGHVNGTSSVCFRPDGAVLASGGSDGQVHLWSVDAGERITSLTGHTGAVGAVVFSPDGRELASGALTGEVRIWDVEEHRLKDEFGDGRPVWSIALAYSPDGRFLAVGDASRDARLFDTHEGEVTGILGGHTVSVSSLAFGMQGRILATASSDRVHLWNVAERAQVRVLSHGEVLVYAVAVNPAGSLVATGGYRRGTNKPGSSVYLWDIETGTFVAELEAHGKSIRDLEFHPDGQRLAALDRDGGVRVWDVPSRQQRQTIHGFTQSVTSIDFSPDGRLLATASVGGRVRMWNMDTRRQAAVGENMGYSSRCVRFSPDGRWMAGDSFGKIFLWDVVNDREAELLQEQPRTVRALEFSPDGQTLVVASDDQTIRIWDLVQMRQEAVLDGHGEKVQALQFSADGHLLASGASDHVVRIWETAEYRPLSVLYGHSGEVRDVAFSPDGFLLASASADSTIRLWDVAAGKTLAVFDGHASAVLTLDFSPDGQVLASGAGNSVQLWDLTTHRRTRDLQSHRGAVSAVRFSPDGQILASGSWDGSVLLWPVGVGMPTVVGTSTDDRAPGLPLQFTLQTNFPNPFNDGTVIRFSLSLPGEANLGIYNLLGQKVRDLVNGHRDAGEHLVVWDGRDGSGRELGSGVYLYRLKAGDKVRARRLLMLK